MSYNINSIYNTITLNGDNLIPSQYNNQYLYTFPVSAVLKDSTIALEKVAIFYSWRNISAALNNNVIQIIWPTSTTPITLTITFPDGYYSIADINAFIQSQLVINGLYLVDGNSNYIYYIQLVENAQYYAEQFNFYAVPASLPSGWSNPASITFPSPATQVQLVIPAGSNFSNIVGLPPGTYPAVPGATTTSQLSTYVPQVSPVQSVVMRCNLVRNLNSNPSDILYTFGSDVAYGNLINSTPSAYIYQPIGDGQYVNFTISFFDQNFNPLPILDTNILITLSLSTPKE